MVVSAGASAQAIRPDGRTQTTVATSGAVTSVSTATVNGGNAFNSFSTFNVPTSTTANLYLPAGTANLINIVRDERSNIDGILNAIKDGRIGGNVWFANPNGFIVGNGGVVNVGSLNVSTPSQQFVNSFFLSPGSPDEGSVTQLLNGTAPRNTSGLISIQGKVNAIDGINLSAGVINVGGTLFAGARFLGNAPDFTDVVNANGISSATNIVAKEGRIVIVADGDVTVAGTIAAPGGTGVRGGDISIRAGGNVDLQAGANIIARGNGENSAGGTVYVYGANSATFATGAAIDASAGATGNGGAIELSAKNTVNLDGGQFRAGAENGAAGSVLIDPNDVTISASVLANDGANYSFTADSITVNGNVIISTRQISSANQTAASIDATLYNTSNSTGNSGSITLTAPSIVLNPGARLYSHAINSGGTTHTGGDITLTASKTWSPTLVGGHLLDASATTGILIDGAILRGRNITASATSDARYEWAGDALNIATHVATEFATQMLFAYTGLNVGAAISKGTSSVVVKNGSTLDATGGTVTLGATTTTKSESIRIGLDIMTQNTVANVGFVWGQTDATATVDVQSGATIKAATLDMSARNNATMDVNVIGISKDTSINAAAAVTAAKVHSTANIDANATIDVTGNVSVKARNVNSFNTSATAMALGVGKVGAALAFVDNNTSATATVGANLQGTGLQNVTVQAYDDTDRNKVSASGSAGSSFVGLIIEAALDGASNFLPSARAKSNAGSQTIDAATGGSEPPRLAAAVTYMTDTHNATAKIGTGVAKTIDAAQNVVASAQVRDNNLRNQSTSSVDGEVEGGTVVSAAVAVGFYNHNATATIGDGMTVKAKNVGVRAYVTQPYEITWDKWEGVSTITSKLSSNLGIASGLLTSFVNSTSETGENGLGLTGSFNYLEFNNKADASFSRTSHIVAKAPTNAAWSTTLETGTANWLAPIAVDSHIDLHTVSSAGSLSLLLNGTGGGTGATSVGGSYNQMVYNNTSRAWIAEGAVVEQESGQPLVDVAVHSEIESKLISIAPTSGRGASNGANMIFALAKVNDESQASIDNEAQVKARNLRVDANEEVVTWSLAGALTKSSQASVGAGVAIANVDTNTRAFIGDNDANRTAAGNVVVTGGKVIADSLAVDARTDGRIETIGVAGAAATSSDPKEDDPNGKVNKAKSKIAGAKASFLAKIGKGSGTAPTETAPMPSFGLAVAGASAVNLVNLGTHASIQDGSTVEMSAAATGASVKAVSDVDITAAAGAAALARANNPSSQASGAIAGALAYNDIGNTTEAYIKGSTLTNATDLSVTALAGGEQLSVGIGASANVSSSKPDRAAAIAGSVSLSFAANKISARIEDSSITGQSTGSGRDVQLTAYDRLYLGTGAGSLTIGGRAGIGAAVSYSEISDTTEAVVSNSSITNYDSALVNAFTSTRIGAGGGMAAVTTTANGASLAGSFVLTEINNTVRAQVKSNSVITVSGSIGVKAADTTGIAALSTIIDTKDGVDSDPAATQPTQMDYTGSAIGTSGLAAGAGSSILSVAGVLTGSTNSLGFSYSQNTVSNSFVASSTESALTAGTTSGSVNIEAQSNAYIGALAVGVGLASKIAGSGSLTVNDISNSIIAEATSTSSKKITAATVLVSAEDKSRLDSLAGSVTISSGNAAIGGAVGINEIDNTVRGKLSGIELDAQTSTSVRATNDSRIRNLSASAGGASNFAFNGSASVNEISNTTEASVQNVRADDTGNALTVIAKDSSVIKSLAGGVAVAFSGGAVGAATAVNQIGNTTSAYVTGFNSNGNLGIKDLQVKAESAGSVDTVAVGVGGGVSVGVGASVAYNKISSTTDAYITGGADIEAENNVGVIATSDDSVKVLAGASGIGISAAGVGASVSINKLEGVTRAYLSGASTKVAARAKDTSQLLTVAEGSLTSPVDLLAGLSLLAYTGPADLTAKRKTESVAGIAVNASATHSIETQARNISGGAYAGVAGTTNVGIIGGSTIAYIDAARINGGDNSAATALQGVQVKASDHAYAADFIGSISGGTAGIGLAVDTNVFNRTTKAYVQSNTIDALGGATVMANSTQGVSSFVVGGAGGVVGVVGTGTVTKFTSLTEAYANSATINAATLTVEGRHASRMFNADGALALGASVGVAGTFAVGLDASTTKAHIDASNANVSGLVAVDANSTSEMRNWAISGAGAGSTAVAGMAVVALIGNTTQAYVSGGSSIGSFGTAAGGLRVSAYDSTTVDNNAGAGAAGFTAGVGAGASVTKVDSTVTAYVDDSNVYTTNNVAVTAQAERNLSTTAVTLGLGLTTGISGAVAVTVVGAALGSDAGGELGSGSSGTLASVDSFSGGNRLDASGGGNVTTNSTFTQADIDAANSAGTISTAASIAPAQFNQKTSASISGTSNTIRAGGDISVTSSEKDKLATKVGSGAGGAVAVGAAVGVTNVTNNVEAKISGSVGVTSTGGSVLVFAATGDLDPSKKGAEVKAYQGSGGLAAVNASVATVSMTNNVTASIGRGTSTSVSGAGNLSVSATDATSVNAEARAYTVGLGAAGAAVASSSKSGTALASIGDIAASGAATSVSMGTGSLIVASDRGGSVDAYTQAGSGGAYSGSGSGATATDSSASTARIGNAVQVTGSANIAVQASAHPDVGAVAEGFSVGLSGGVGASVALATASPVSTAFVGDSAQLAGNSLLVSAENALIGANESAYASAVGGSGGVLFGVNATLAMASSQEQAIAYTGAGVKLTDGGVTVRARNTSRQKSLGTGVAIGGLAAGATITSATSTGTTTARLGSGTTTSTNRAGDLTVSANSDDSNDASAIAGSGGVVAGNGASATTTDTAMTTATMDGGTIRAGSVLVDAKHTDNYAAKTDSVNAAVAGGSGAVSSNTGNATTLANVAGAVALTASRTVDITAKNIFNSTTSGSSATAAAGGVINGSAAISSTTLTGSSQVTLGNGASITSGTDPVVNPGGIRAVASSELNHGDTVTLATGGLIQGAGTDSTLNATFGNTVTIGTGDQLKSQGSIGAGTFTKADANTSSLASTWGAAAVGSAAAITNVTSNQSVVVNGGGTLIEAFGNVDLTTGRDPNGSRDTTLDGGSSAQAYVRGLIAVPVASASTNLTSNTSLSIANGATVKSGQNVTLGAYRGTVDPTADGTGHGYELGFIPVTNGTSHTSAPTTASVAVNGAVSAGIYRSLIINSSGNTLVADPGGAPFVYTYTPNFNIQNFIAQNYEGTQALLLASGVATGTVGAFTVGTLFAAGGTVTVNADTLAGSGSLTSYGAPKITLTNSSPNYLILGPALIPNTPGAKIIFTGTAGRAQAGAIALDENGAGLSPVIDIKNTYTGAVGTSAGNYGPAVVLTGTVENLGGLVSIYNANGSLGQLDTIYGQQVTLDIPNGVAVINVQGSRPYYAGGNPYSEWRNYMIWPGGNPANGVPNADQAITYVANSEFNSGGTYTTTGSLTQRIIGTLGQTSGGSTLYFAGTNGCYPYGCDAGTANARSPAGSSYALTGSGPNGPFYFPAIPVQTLFKTASSYSLADLTGSQNSRAVYGGQVSIKAQYLDVNGKIVAGQPTNHSISLPASLTAPVVFGPVFDHYEVKIAGGFPQIVPVYRTDVVGGGAISLFDYYYGKGQITNPEYDVPAAVTRSGDSLMGATYNAQSKTITVKDVSASSGGGYVKVEGGILSSNTLGQIHVNGGLGDVDVSNQTSLPVTLGKVNAGNAALAQGLSSKVEIIDTMRSSSANHWLYEYVPGQGITLYSGAQTAAIGPGAAGNASVTPLGGSATSFAPTAGLRWNWSEYADLSRTVSTDASGFIQTPTNWVWNNVVLNNPWHYSDQFGNASASPTGWLTTQANQPVFKQTVSGATTNMLYYSYGYGGCDSGPAGAQCNYGFVARGQNSAGTWRGYWDYNYPRNAHLTLSSSVKADNPVAIDFSGNSRGAVAINSNAAVSINGQVINPNGNTTITAGTGSITETPTGGLLSNNLTLSAGAGIGAQGSALKATLTSNGLLNAQGGNTGVFLNINSAATVGTVASGGAAAGYGDVVLNADNDLFAGTVGAGAANVTGRNITVKSNLGSVGSEATPLILASKPTALTSGATSGGIVNVSALSNIGLTHIGGDLLIGSIASTAGGDVYLNVPNGTILGAAGQTAAQALDPDQVRKVWQDLKLTTAYGAEQPGDANARSVVNFQTQVNTTYRNFWRLRANGSVAGGTLSLNSTGLALYRPLAAAALGTANPSDAQVQAFANGQYQNALTYLNSSLGSSWTGTANGQNYNGGFNYVATSAQVTNLTQNAVWSENELSYAINRTALQPSAGAVGVGTPYISGRDIKLVTQGAIGKLAAPVTVTLSDLQAGNLTAGQKAAVALAIAPGDVTAVDASGNPVGTGLTPYAFQIQQTAPVFLDAAGKLTTTSGGVTFVQSTGQNLSIDHVQSGGNVSIAAPQSILQAAGAPAKQIDATGDLTLLAGSGSIGTSAAPITYQISGNLLSASATQNTYLSALGGNMTIGRVFAGNTASLNAPDGSILSYLGGLVIQGDSVSLVARDDIGSSSRALQVQVGTSGLLSGSAGGRAWILSPDTVVPLNVGTFSANGGMNLTSNSDLNAQLLRSSAGAIVAAAGADANIAAINSGISTASSGAVTVTAVGDLTVGAAATTPGAITLQAGGLTKVTGLVSSGSGNIAVSGNTIDVAAGGSLVSATGTIGLQAVGDIFIDKLQTGNATASAISIASATGRVLEASSDAAADIIANNAGAVVTITAPGGIGNATRTGATTVDTTTPNAIETQVAGLSATSTGGGIYIAETDALIVGNVVSNGLLQVSAGGALTGTKLQSTAGSVSASAGSASLATLAAAIDASLTTTTGSLAVTGSAAGRDVTLIGKTGVTTATVTASRNATLIAQGGNINATSTTATAGDVAMTASSDVTAATTNAGTDISMTASAGNVSVTTSAISSHDVTLNAGTNITTASVTGANNVTMTAGSAVNATTTQATNGTLTATATNGLMTLGTANSEGQMTLAGKTGIVAGSLTTDTGSVSATSGSGDLSLTTTDAANAVSLTATLGSVKVDTVEAQNGVSINAGTSIFGKVTGRIVRVESLGGNVSMTSGTAGGTGTITTALTRAASDISMGGRTGVDATTTTATNGTLGMSSGAGALAIGSANSEGQMTLTGQTGITAGTLTTDTGSINATTNTGDLTLGTTGSATDATLAATLGNVNLTTTTTGRDALVTAGTDINSTTLTATRNAQLTAQGGTLNATTTRAINGTLGMTTNTGTMTIGSARSGSTMTLDSKKALTATTLTTDAATLNATARTQDLAVTTTASTAGAANLTATTGNVKVDTVDALNDINVTAGSSILGKAGARYVRIESTAGNVTLNAQNGDITGNLTQAFNNSQITAKNNIDLTSTNARNGALTATAQTGSMTIGSANSEDQMTLQAQTGITANSLTTDTGSIAATATTGDLSLTTTDAANAVSLTASAGNVKVDTVEAQNDVTVNAGTSILGKAAGRYLRVESLGGNVIQNAQGGGITGDLTRGAVNTQMTASNNIDTTTTVATAGSVTMTGGANVTAATTSAGTNISMTATAGDVTATTAVATNGTLGLSAGQDAIVLTNATSGGDMTLTGQRHLKILSPATLQSTGANITGNAVTGDIDVNAATAFGSITFTAGGSVRFGIASAGQNVSFTATTGDVNATTTSAGGNLSVVAANDIVLGTATTGGNQLLTAGSDLTATTLVSTGGSIFGQATTGNVTLGDATAQVNATFDAGDALTARTITAVSGDATVHTYNDITIDTYRAGNDALLDSSNGSMNVTRIIGDGVLLLAKSDVVAPDLKVGRRLVLTSNTVNAGVTHTRSDLFLQATLIGRNNPIMSSVILTLNSPLGVEFSRFWAQDANVNVLHGLLQLTSGYIGHRMLVNNPLTSVLMDNTSPFVQNPYDAQLYSASKGFWMNLDRSILRVRAADIVHREMQNHTVISETTGLDSSVDETSVEEVIKAGRIVLPGLGILLQPSGELIRFSGNPVMMQDLEPQQQSDEDEKPK